MDGNLEVNVQMSESGFCAMLFIVNGVSGSKSEFH